MKINKLKVWKKVEKFVGQRCFSRYQDKFYVRYNFYNLNHQDVFCQKAFIKNFA